MGIKYTKELEDPSFETGTPENDKTFLSNLIAFYCVLEGMFFYCGFTDPFNGQKKQNDWSVRTIPVHHA